MYYYTIFDKMSYPVATLYIDLNCCMQFVLFKINSLGHDTIFS